MAEFSVINSLLGGVLIGLGGGLLLLFNGRIAGISGIMAGVVLPRAGEWLWRAVFLIGLVIGGFAASWSAVGVISFGLERSMPTLIVAGLLVASAPGWGPAAPVAMACAAWHVYQSDPSRPRGLFSSPGLQRCIL